MKAENKVLIILASAMIGAGLLSSFILWLALDISNTAGLAKPVVPVLAPLIISLFAFSFLYPYLKRNLLAGNKDKGSVDIASAATKLGITASATAEGASTNAATTVGIIANSASTAGFISKSVTTDGITSDATMNGSAPASVDENGSRQLSSEMSPREIKAMLQHAADVICLIDVNASLLQVNPASIPVWGYKPDELIGRNLKDFLESDEDIKATLQALLVAEKSVDQLHFENRFRKKSGEVADMLWSAHWSISDGGLFCVAHNITERKRSERLLRESEERIREILENLPAGVVVINKSGCLEFMNRTAFGLTEYPNEADLSEIRAPGMFSFCKEPFFMKQLDGVISNQKAPSIECFVTCQTGERFPADASVSHIKINGEKCCLVIFLDAKIKHELERTKREFVAMVSHDLRSPLTSISMILSYFADGHAGDMNPRGVELASKSKKECDRLMIMVKDLLDLEKMKSGKFTMNLSKTNIVEVINAAVSTLDRSQASQGVKFSINTPEELVCVCDGARIIQVLVNLLDNATKYSSQGGEVKINASAGDNEIKVSITNKGRPIPPEKIAGIFERFEQVEESDAREKKGTGLGLAICKTIVEQHNGSISLTSSNSEGTCFTFTIPRTAGAEEVSNLLDQTS